MGQLWSTATNYSHRRLLGRDRVRPVTEQTSSFSLVNRQRTLTLLNTSHSTTRRGVSLVVATLGIDDDDDDDYFISECRITG